MPSSLDSAANILVPLIIIGFVIFFAYTKLLEPHIIPKIKEWMSNSKSKTTDQKIKEVSYEY